MTREELYQRFGPKLIDALTQILLNEINILREEAGLSERTGNQIIEAIGNKLENIPNYAWMNEEL